MWWKLKVSFSLIQKLSDALLNVSERRKTTPGKTDWERKDRHLKWRLIILGLTSTASLKAGYNNGLIKSLLNSDIKTEQHVRDSNPKWKTFPDTSYKDWVCTNSILRTRKQHFLWIQISTRRSFWSSGFKVSNLFTNFLNITKILLLNLLHFLLTTIQIIIFKINRFWNWNYA